MKNDLITAWAELTARYTANTVLIDELWLEIEQHYSYRKRYYHNLAHLEYMLEKTAHHREQLSDIDTFQFSIFYHDLIYNPRRRDNELKSAEIARERLSSLGFPTDKIDTCAQQILATKDHRAHADTDTNYLVDIDLAILGESPEVYKNYTQKIRAEYSIYPDFLYKKGRKKVLQHFLQMDRIFKTDVFFADYELQARENLKRELLELS